MSNVSFSLLESKYITIFEGYNLNENFYFSYDIDLTKSI